jgi:hypothetical protein
VRQGSRECFVTPGWVVKAVVCVAAVTIDGQDMKLSNGWFEDSWTYNCLTGGSVAVLWQLYRPLLGNTVEITTGETLQLSSPSVSLLALSASGYFGAHAESEV